MNRMVKILLPKYFSELNALKTDTDILMQVFIV